MFRCTSLLECVRVAAASFTCVPAGSPSRGEDAAVYVNDINQHAPFYSVLVSVAVSMALSTAFHSRNSADNSPLCLSVLPVLILPYWSIQLCSCFLFFFNESLPQH